MSNPGNNNGGWGQPPQNGNNGWGQPPQANNNGWGQPPQNANNGWGQPPQANNNGWGQPPQHANNGWGQPPQANNNGWGQPPQGGNNGWAPPAPPPAANANPWGGPQPNANPNANPAPNPWGQPPQGNPNPNPGQGVLNMNQQTFLTKVFGWMGMGLGLTGVVGAITYATGLIYMLGSMRMILGLGLVGFVWWLGSALNRLSPQAAIASFLGYAGLNGVVLSAIFVIYSPISIVLAFFGAASMFGFMFVLGITTKRDLGPMGRALGMVAFGLMVVSLLNFGAYMLNLLPDSASFMISWGISAVGIFVFAGLTAYDAQFLKQLSSQGFQSHADETRWSVIGALHLYLNFINMFLMLLRLFGGRRE
jgi:uncharacterized protein